MSKIIEALEKAKRDGTSSAAACVVDELRTVAPVEEGETAPARALWAAERRGDRSGAAVGVPQPSPGVAARVDARIEAVQNPRSMIAERYRSLRNRIERLDLGKGHLRAFGLTSAIKGEGKSLTSCNLAITMANDESKRILLVDADLRNPTVHRLLGLELSPGLAEVLRGRACADEVSRESGIFGLTVVTAGVLGEGHPSELLASRAFGAFVASSRANFDFILFDCPPLHPVSDVSFLVEALDGAILVVRAGKTPKGILRDAAASLPSGKLVGAVLNRIDDRDGDHGYGGGYGGRYSSYGGGE